MTGHRYANKVVDRFRGDFTVEGSDVIIRTSSGGKLAAAASGSVVAFEADEATPAPAVGAALWYSATLPRSVISTSWSRWLGPTASRGCPG